LIDSLGENYCVNRNTYFNCDEEELSGVLLYLKPEQNWNIDPRFEGKFDEYFISQAIHDLYDHSVLSFPDILKINRLQAELQVTHQHIVKL